VHYRQFQQFQQMSLSPSTSFYYTSFAIVSVVTFVTVVALACLKRRATSQSPVSSFRSSIPLETGTYLLGTDEASHLHKSPDANRSLRIRYLIIFFLAFLADWFQGPYVYALYKSYGYNENAIEILFLCGFASSMFFGTFIGGLADKIGRKRAAVLYCFIYIGCCGTKHFSSFPLLVLGRILGGIATSLLFSTFESWLVSEHSRITFSSKTKSKQALSETLALAQFGNGIVAIVAGQIAQAAVGIIPLTPAAASSASPSNITNITNTTTYWTDLTFHFGGDIVPFDCSAFVLICCALATFFLWDENYGVKDLEQKQQPGQETIATQWKNALLIVLKNNNVLLCGIISASFEAAMYLFVILWTPALTSSSLSGSNESPPCGLIFSTFMVCCMAGSCIFSCVATFLNRYTTFVFALIACIGAFTMSVPIWSSDVTERFFAFLLFEITVGFYYPAMGTLRAELIQDESRSTVYNIFRVPLNLVVASVLLARIEDIKIKFMIAMSLLIVSTVGCMVLAFRTRK